MILSRGRVYIYISIGLLSIHHYNFIQHHNTDDSESLNHLYRLHSRVCLNEVWCGNYNIKHRRKEGQLE